MPIDPLDPSGIRTYEAKSRSSKVSSMDLAKPPKIGMTVSEFFDRLPNILAAGDLKSVIDAVVRAVRNKRPVMFSMGAHPIKVGMGPLIVDLMERGVVSHVALNGAGIIHDFELAYIGSTSEDVAEALDDGSFGMARDTADILNGAIARGAAENDQKMGLGRSVGEMIEKEEMPYRASSILAAGARLGIPVTVHVALGTDIIHMHPSANGADIGTTSMRDFYLFSASVAGLSGGVYFNIGSAVIMPEVFLKAVALARNLGHPVEDFFAVNMDFMQQYRPHTNVVTRPTMKSGRGVNLIGHHEIMIPLLCAGVVDGLT
ncbi:MAG: hypothetical protein JW885_14020 [Deltaproteobacteria bacterium]|nr:hypothetical protein [Candidatus Zymogenaceae bacterium]